MIADFINAFFHKVVQGYDTSGISSGASAQVRDYTITELDSSTEYCIALRKNKFWFPDACGV